MKQFVRASRYAMIGRKYALKYLRGMFQIGFGIGHGAQPRGPKTVIRFQE